MTHLPASSLRSFTSSVGVTTCLLSLALGLAACNGGREKYPDTTQETRLHADEIRADGLRRTEKIEADLVQQERALDFRATQIQTVAARDRDQIILERDKENQPVLADEAVARATAEREKIRIDDDLNARIKQVDGAEADRLRADAASRKAELERKRTEDLANTTVKRSKAEATAREKKAAIDEREAKDLAAIKNERENAQLKARADRLGVEADVNKRLNDMAEEAKKRTDKNRDDINH